MRTSIAISLKFWMLTGILLCCFATTADAQRSKERRKRTLTTDSIRAKHLADSLSLLDTTRVVGKGQFAPDKVLPPVDTLRLRQRTDSVMKAKAKPVELPKKQWIPKSQKSLWLALIFPGAGQIYNRKYWKLPLIYGGFVGCAYALMWNNNMYKDYSQAYQDIMSDNPTAKSYENFLPSHVDVKSNLAYYQELFRNRKNLYRRQRDLSIIVTIGVYLLSVIDAYVDAELSDFDISTDLSMSLEPTVFNDNRPNEMQGVGLKCTLKF